MWFAFRWANHTRWLVVLYISLSFALASRIIRDLRAHQIYVCTFGYQLYGIKIFAWVLTIDSLFSERFYEATYPICVSKNILQFSQPPHTEFISPALDSLYTITDNSKMLCVGEKFQKFAGTLSTEHVGLFITLFRNYIIEGYDQ